MVLKNAFFEVVVDDLVVHRRNELRHEEVDTLDFVEDYVVLDFEETLEQLLLLVQDHAPVLHERDDQQND